MAAPQLDLKQALSLLQGLAPEQLSEIEAVVDPVIEALGGEMPWVPNSGPQTVAYECEADQVLYGGAAGGGKTQLLIGKALQKHQRSLILRRLNAEVQYLVDLTEDVLGTSEGYSGQHKRWYLPGDRLMMFGGCQHPGDERKYRGEPKDFIGIDEASEFLESQVEFVRQWLRTDDPNQKVQLLLGSNPPDGPNGEWLTRWFAPWVDPDHPLFPQPDGKLLYWAREKEGNDFRWSEEPFDIYDERTGKTHRALSRTFIRSTLDDNPDYAETGYSDTLASADEDIRARLERGEFISEPNDDPYQIIPTAWVMLAQSRWKDMKRARPGPPSNSAMTSIGVDIAQGGKDRTILARRYGEWYDELVVRPGKETPDGPTAAGLVLSYLRDAAQVNIDMGGGWGGSCFDFLKGNEAVSLYGFDPSGGSMQTSACGNYKFRNLRAEAYWRFREALDPNGIYRLALPPDPELKQELCITRRRELGPGGVVTVQDKSEIKKEIGRSPDKADAVVIAWYTGMNRMRPLGGVYASRARQTTANLQQRTNQGHRSSKRDRYANRHQPVSSGGGEQG